MTLQSVKEVIASVAHCFPWVLESYRLTQLSRQLSATSSVPRVFSSSSHHTRQRRRCAQEMERDAGAVCVSACSAARRATSASRSMSRAVARRLNCFDDREATLGIWDLGTLAAARAAPLLQRIGHLGWLLLSFPQCDRVLKTILGSSGTVSLSIVPIGYDAVSDTICKLAMCCVRNTRLHNGFPAIHARPFRPSGQ